jgi:hypothetical protein
MGRASRALHWCNNAFFTFYPFTMSQTTVLVICCLLSAAITAYLTHYVTAYIFSAALADPFHSLKLQKALFTKLGIEVRIKKSGVDDPDDMPGLAFWAYLRRKEQRLAAEAASNDKAAIADAEARYRA